MIISRIQLYIFGFICLSAPFIAYRLIWLSTSKTANAVVLDIYETRRGGQTYPVLQFQTENEVVRFRGHYNTDYAAGESVVIRYQPRNPSNCLINTFWDIWIRPAIFIGMIFFIWTFLFVRYVIPKGKFKITRKGIRRLKEEERFDEYTLVD